MKLTEKISVASLASVLFKFLLAGVTIKLGEKSIDFGPIDAMVIAAILTPTIGAPHLEEYVLRPKKAAADKAKDDNKK